MKISKVKAEEAAKQLLSKRVEKHFAKKKNLKDWVQELCESKIPKEIKELSIKYPDFFIWSSHVRLIGEGISNYEMRNIRLSSEILMNKNHEIHLSQQEANHYVSEWNKNETESQQIDNAYDVLIQSILAFGTLNRLELDFPEAAALIPKPNVKTQLSIHVSELRKLIK
jgi:hypothetical protein